MKTSIQSILTKKDAAIKNVYRKTRSVLITLDRREANRIRQKDGLAFDDFITKLARKRFILGSLGSSVHNSQNRKTGAKWT